MQVGIFDWDVARGRTLSISPRKERRGLLYRKVASGESEALMHPEDRPLMRAAVERFLAGTTESLKVTRRARSATWPGGWIHLSVYGKAVERDAAGRPLRVLGIYRNVTDEIERKAAARRREAAVSNATRLASLGELARKPAAAT